MTLPMVVLLFWAGTVAWMDLLWRKIRWWWLLVGLLGAGGYRLTVWLRDGFAPHEALVIFIVVTGGYALWKESWWGGADAKTAMALVAALPQAGFIGVAAGLILIVSTVAILARRRGRSLPRLVSDSMHAVRSGRTAGERIPLAAVMVAAVPVFLGLTIFIQ